MLETINELIGWVIIGFFVCLMLFLAKKEHASIGSPPFLDYKSTIISLGILGTFLGIFLGLLEFDTDNIKASVPKLLAGLKVAFVTSIAGMAIASILTIREKGKATGAADDEVELLKNIDTTLKETQGQSEKNFNKFFEQIQLLRQESRDASSTLQTSVTANLKEANTSLAEFRQESQAATVSVTEKFDQTNESLRQAIDALSRGATEEIIKALETVISDFNQNLTDQFGGNFTQLNEACWNLVQWQAEYQETLAKSQTQLEHLLSAFGEIENTQRDISARNKETADVYEKLREIIETFSNQTQGLTALLERYADLGTRAADMFDAVKQGIDGTTNQLNEFSGTMQNTVTAQSKALFDLTEKQLPGVLNQLEASLTALTENFSDSYKSFLERVAALERPR